MSLVTFIPDIGIDIAHLTHLCNAITLQGDLEVFQLNDDIFAFNKDVAPHQDSTASGLDTIGLVLAGECELAMVTQSVELAPGNVFRFDARFIHSANINSESDRVVMVIWDVPSIKPTEEVVVELQRRTIELIDNPAALLSNALKALH